ncbi:protein DEK isoform X1 [Hyaena hyaena]|nr:protein DEK isoform X1 [Hyaena hyaena]
MPAAGGKAPPGSERGSPGRGGEATWRPGFPRPPASWGREGAAPSRGPPCPCRRGRGDRVWLLARPQVGSMSSSGPAAEGDGTPAQPASEKEPEMPGRRDESEEEDEDDEEEEEEEEEEEKEKSLIVEGKREKKKVERLTMQVSSLQREPFTIAQGKGQKLCEIERIHFFLSKKKTDELRNLHKLLYNRPGTVSSLKKNVGQFSGFPFEKGSVQYKKKEEMLKKFRNAMLKSICEVLDLERSGVNSELVKRILNFLMHPKPSGKPLPKSKKTSSKGNKKERNSSGMARKAKRTKCPEILSDESSSDEDEKKNKEESSDEEDKESEEEPPKKTSKKEKPKQKATPKSKKTVKSANVKKADSSTTKKNQNSSKKESESEDSSDDEPLIKKLKKPPTDEELKETVKKLLASANLEEVTMKQICKEVYENYPAYDLTERKDFIKTTVKELIS